MIFTRCYESNNEVAALSCNGQHLCDEEVKAPSCGLYCVLNTKSDHSRGPSQTTQISHQLLFVNCSPVVRHTHCTKLGSDVNRHRI